MTLHSPVLIQPASGDPSLVVTGQEFRRYTDAMLALPTALPFSSANWSGGVPDGGWSASANTGSMTVVQRGAGANFSVDVAAGTAFVIGTDVTSQGTYACWNDATVNVVTPGAPGAGTRVHRLVLQIQDKLSNGAWTGYQAQFVLLQDTGGGTPAAGNSALTLALISIAAGQASVLNANITDYRRNIGPCAAFKTADTTKGNTSFATDADLQLWGLAHNAWYKVEAEILYNAAGPGTGDLKFTFNAPSNVGQNNVGGYQFFHLSAGNAVGGTARSNWQDTSVGGGNGSGAANDMGLILRGSLFTGTVTPNNWIALQWAQNSSSGTNTTVRQGSWLRAERIA
jgi:hypothetical protein